LLCAGAYAAETYEADLGSVTVTTPYRSEVALDDISADVDVLYDDDIRQTGAANAADALDRSGVLDVQTRTGFGQPGSFSLNGSEAYQTRVMVDGIDLRTPATEYVVLGRMSAFDLSRIEVVRSATSSAWGTGMGGAVNLITKEPNKEKPVSVSAEGFYSGYRGRRESSDISGTMGGFGYLISQTHEQSGSAKSFSDTSVDHTLTKLSYDTASFGRVFGEYGTNDGSYNSGLFPDTTSAYQAMKFRQAYGKVGWDVKTDSLRLNAEQKMTREVNDSDSHYHTTPTVSFDQYKGVHHQTSLFSAWSLTDDDRINTGFDFDRETLKRLDGQLADARQSRAYAPYTSYVMTRGATTYEAGLRYDRGSEYRGTASPSAGVSHATGLTWLEHVKLNAGRGFTAPRLLWKYIGDLSTSYRNNPSLKPEKSWNVTPSIDGKIAEPLAYKASAFYADISDMFITETFDAGTPGDTSDDYDMYVNKTRYRKTGAEGSLEYTFLRDWKAGAGAHVYRYYDRKAHTWSKPSSLPSHATDFSLGYDNPSIVTAKVSARYTRWYMPYDTYLPNDRKFMLDFTSEKKFKPFTAFFNVYNLSDSKYWSDFWYPYPGRYAEVGLRFEW
jgi:vitamin B12 transporter